MSCECIPVSRKASLFGGIAKIVAIGRDGPCIRRAIDMAVASAEAFEASINRHDADSELNRLCSSYGAGFIPVSSHLHKILVCAGDISYRSDGMFDVVAAGSGGVAQWTDIDLSRDSHARLRRPLSISLGGMAKGYAADLIVKALQECGVGAALVDVGGCIKAYGASEWRIEFSPQSTEPFSPDATSQEDSITVPVMLGNGAVAGFGPYFGMSKLLDIEQGLLISPMEWGNRNILVRSDSCAVADALTKIVALQDEKPEKMLQMFGAVASDMVQLPTPSFHSQKF